MKRTNRNTAFRSHRRPRRRSGGFTLLEVVLALAIFTGSMVVLGQLVRLATENAQKSVESVTAQLLCQGKMDELVSGTTPIQAVQQTVFDTQPEWLHSVEVVSTGQPGIVAVYVTVQRDTQSWRRAVPFTLVRWMRDPSLELPEENSLEAIYEAMQAEASGESA